MGEKGEAMRKSPFMSNCEALSNLFRGERVPLLYAQEALDAAVAEERERCAKLCEQTGAYTDQLEMAQMCAAAIRARSEEKQ